MIEGLLGLDENLFVLINTQLSNGLFDAILVPLRHKFFWIPLYIFLISFIWMNYGNKRWIVFLGIIITVFMSDTFSSKIIKKSVQRTRPCHEALLNPIKRVPCSHGFSFTSSHATNHFAIGTFLFLLLSFTKYRYLFLLWAAVISFAQVYVGVHYPLDVLCGTILGLLIGYLSYNILKSLDRHFYKTQNTVA